MMSQNLTPSLIKDIKPGADSSSFEGLINFNEELYFIANSSLWKSDGKVMEQLILMMMLYLAVVLN